MVGSRRRGPSSPDDAGLMPSSRIAPHRICWRRKRWIHVSITTPPYLSCSPREQRLSVACLVREGVYISSSRLYIFQYIGGHFCPPRWPPPPTCWGSLPPSLHSRKLHPNQVSPSSAGVVSLPKSGSTAPAPPLEHVCVRPISAARDDRNLSRGREACCPAWSFLFVVEEPGVPVPGAQVIRNRGTAFSALDSKRTPRRGAHPPGWIPGQEGPPVRGVGWWRMALLLAPPRDIESSAAVSIHGADTHTAHVGMNIDHYEQVIKGRKNGSMARSIHHTCPLSAFYPQLVLCTWLHMLLTPRSNRTLEIRGDLRRRIKPGSSFGPAGQGRVRKRPNSKYGSGEGWWAEETERLSRFFSPRGGWMCLAQAWRPWPTWAWSNFPACFVFLFWVLGRSPGLGGPRGSKTLYTRTAPPRASRVHVLAGHRQQTTTWPEIYALQVCRMQPHASQEGSAPHAGEDGKPPSWPSGLFIGTVPKSVTTLDRW